MRAFSPEEIGEVLEMVLFRELDIRAVTLSVNTLPAIRGDVGSALSALRSLLGPHLERFRPAVDKIAAKLGVRIVTARLAVSPVSVMLEPLGRAEDAVEISPEGRVNVYDGVAIVRDLGDLLNWVYEAH